MLEIEKLIWDNWNKNHIARHGVSSDEVEEACHIPHAIRETYKNRLMLIGITKKNRILAIVLEKEAEKSYYVVTARTANRKEQQIFQSEKGGVFLKLK